MKSDKSFFSAFENKVHSTIDKYGLISKKDKILVACSGGKDSTTALYVLKKLGYNAEAITVDALIGSYSKKNLENLKKFCIKHKIKLHIVSFRDIFGCSLCYIISVLKSKGHKVNSCSICGVLRRHILNKKAKQLKATKIVTGHNLDDEVQSFLMNILRGKPELNARLGPVTGMIKDKRFVPRVKPLYFCFEKETERYSKLHNFPVKYEKCPCVADAYRNHLRNLTNKLDEKTRQNILNSFIAMLPALKQQHNTTKKLCRCSCCGEPCIEGTCNACKIIELVKQKL